MTTLYLNNSGDKWIEVNYNRDYESAMSAYTGRNSSTLDRSPMDFMLVKEDGTIVKRRADYYQQFGNFATVEFRIKGIRYGGFFESFERINDLPVLRNYSNRNGHNIRSESPETIALKVKLGL